MRTYVAALAEDGEYITPNEINDELRELVGAAHSLDRDNFLPNDLTPAKVALGTFGKILISESEQRIDIIHGGTSGSDTSQIHPIPFDLDGGRIIPWLETMDTGDCELEISLGVGWTDPVPANDTKSASTAVRKP